MPSELLDRLRDLQGYVGWSGRVLREPEALPSWCVGACNCDRSLREQACDGL